MNDRQRVEFDLPKPVWFALATIADKRDITVADVIAEAIGTTVEEERASTADRTQTRDRIVELVKTGLTDVDIAAHLDLPRRQVSTTRRNANLPINRPGMANHQKETA